ncbi:hypothetical protein [Eubacterium limosum]|uniref:hypothetical protein n=1 Tax=Eubacterium limosum TaxID=1736 RepID=UPI0010626F74|nr:hypothetical protein [Eubacterium limosum]
MNQKTFKETVSDHFEEKGLIVTIKECKLGKLEAISIAVFPKKGGPQVFKELVPSEGANWDIAIKNLERKINFRYGKKII